jgi:hypothetical protein
LRLYILKVPFQYRPVNRQNFQQTSKPLTASNTAFASVGFFIKSLKPILRN